MRHIMALLLILLLALSTAAFMRGPQGKNIEDFLLDEWKKHKILVIPEWLSHDSYESMELALGLLKRWTENDHGIESVILGLETDCPTNSVT